MMRWKNNRCTSLLAGGAALILLLAGCATDNNGPTAQDPVDGGSQAVDEPAGDLVPAGFADGFGCETITDLIPTFTQGLYLNTASSEGEDGMACAWSDIPLDTMVPIYDDLSTSLDVIVRIDFEENASPSRIENYCSGTGLTTTAAGTKAVSGLGGCGGGELADPDGSGPDGGGVWASVPYFDIDLGLSCDLSTTCIYDAPASMTDQAGYEALRVIADRLTTDLEFLEPVIVSEATTGSEFIRDWGEAGFPSEEEQPEWYCDSYLDGNEAYPGVEWSSDRGWEWTVSDERVDDDGIFPEYRLSFVGNGNGEAASYRVSMIGTRCITDITFDTP